jgi:hypothetical protein
MKEPDKRRWIISVLIIGGIYCLDGIVFGKFAGLSKSPAMVFIWRLAAWVTSAVLFAGNIWYEYYRLKNAPFKTALHVSLASALGAFGLAVAANIHAQFVQTANQIMLALSLIIWPLLTMVPAFIVAFVITSLLQYLHKKALPK